MTQKAVDLRRSGQIVRRHKLVVVIVVILGIAAGAAYAVLNPPAMTSIALVALQPPASSSSTQQQAPANGLDPFTATQEVVAASNPVLQGALPAARPAMSLTQLRHNVQVGSPATDIISVTANGKSAGDAEATANAVANSYVAYVSSSSSPVGHVSARELAPAITATGSSPVERMVTYALLGALAGLIIGSLAVLLLGRNDRRLRERDEIARSIGVPVLASFPVAHPTDASGWTRLLEGYNPTAVHALRLRQALQQLGAVSINGHGAGRDGSSFTVLSLASDSGALALGPSWPSSPPPRGLPPPWSSARSRTRTPRPRCGPHWPRRLLNRRNGPACCGSSSPKAPLTCSPTPR